MVDEQVPNVNSFCFVAIDSLPIWTKGESRQSIMRTARTGSAYRAVWLVSWRAYTS